MLQYLRSRAQSFKYAFAGLASVFHTRGNILIHAIATFIVLGLAAWLKLERIEWALLILTISSVWVAEFFNTALEVVVDLASPDIHHLAKIAKDVGAASVLVAAFFSVVIGILVLGPPLFNRLANFF